MFLQRLQRRTASHKVPQPCCGHSPSSGLFPGSPLQWRGWWLRSWQAAATTALRLSSPSLSATCCLLCASSGPPSWPWHRSAPPPPPLCWYCTPHVQGLTCVVFLLLYELVLFETVHQLSCCQPHRTVDESYGTMAAATIVADCMC